MRRKGRDPMALTSQERRSIRKRKKRYVFGVKGKQHRPFSQFELWKLYSDTTKWLTTSFDDILNRATD